MNSFMFYQIVVLNIYIYLNPSIYIDRFKYTYIYNIYTYVGTNKYIYSKLLVNKT